MRIHASLFSVSFVYGFCVCLLVFVLIGSMGLAAAAAGSGRGSGGIHFKAIKTHRIIFNWTNGSN